MGLYILICLKFMPVKKMHNDINKIIEQSLNNCIPEEAEKIRLNLIAQRVKKLIIDYISVKHYSFVTDVVFGGSFAKGTWLKNDTDIDLFVKFESQIDFKSFENYGKEIGIKSLKNFSPYLKFADHPYVEAYVENIKINVVPCFDVKFGHWKSAADRSPFHTTYVVDTLDNHKKKQVIILKQFLKSLNIYGAEISTKGFSGYVSEVLIIKFGSFLSTLNYFSNFSIDKRIIVIDTTSIDLEKLKKFDSFLIILDPIDSNRNLGTAISSLTAGLLIQSSRMFLNNPTNDYFNYYKNISIDSSIMELFSFNVLIVEFKCSFRSPDVIWGQLQKFINSVSKSIELNGFKILKKACYTDEIEHCVFGFLMESIQISKFQKRIGPDIFRKSDVEKFILSNSVSKLKWLSSDTRINCILCRKFTDVREYLKFTFKNNPYLIGIPSDLKSDFLSSVRIYSIDQQENISEHVGHTLSDLLHVDARLFN